LRPEAESNECQKLRSSKNALSSPIAELGSESDAPELADAHTCQPLRSTSRSNPGGENTQ
jgi:hypothetical protein